MARHWTGGRFKFTFTPKHGSRLNLVEGFFSKFGRSVLHYIRVGSKQELKERIVAVSMRITGNGGFASASSVSCAPFGRLSEVHPLGWIGLRPFKWRPAGRVPLQI
jgi:hypothetical protein